MEQETGGFARTYGVELLCESQPSLSLEELLEAVRRHRPAAEPLGRSGEAIALGFVHPDHPIRMGDKVLHPQTCIFSTDKPFQLDDTLEEDLGQSWSFPEAVEVVERCRHTLLVTDMMSSPLNHKERLGLFQDVLAGVLEVVPAWPSTGGRPASSSTLGVTSKPITRARRRSFFAGALNVRFYNISNAPGDMVMDTLGLAALGLPDLQCHFRGLEPGRVAALLANTGYYVFDQGDVIEDGHTVEGLEPGSPWRCQHEDALVPPSRVVLDLDPGPSHASGDRMLSE